MVSKAAGQEKKKPSHKNSAEESLQELLADCVAKEKEPSTPELCEISMTSEEIQSLLDSTFFT